MTASESKKVITQRKPRFALDTNTFHNLGFLYSLRVVKDHFEFLLPSVVTLEAGFFFMVKGASWEEFTNEIHKFGGKLLDWKTVTIPDVLKSALNQRTELQFRHHFRDFLIGTQCNNEQADLITYNKKHFNWCTKISVVTPEEFSLKHASLFSPSSE